MKMFKCLDCGGIFEDGEQGSYQDPVGEYEGQTAYQTVYCCPYCNHYEYDEIQPCKICGSYDHDLEAEYCEECIDDVRKRFMFFLSDFNENEKSILKNLELVAEEIL